MKCPNDCGTTLTKDVLDPNDDLFKHYGAWLCEKCNTTFSERVLLMMQFEEDQNENSKQNRIFRTP